MPFNLTSSQPIRDLLREIGGEEAAQVMEAPTFSVCVNEHGQMFVSITPGKVRLSSPLRDPRIHFPPRKQTATAIFIGCQRRRACSNTALSCKKTKHTTSTSAVRSKISAKLVFRKLCVILPTIMRVTACVSSSRNIGQAIPLRTSLRQGQQGDDVKSICPRKLQNPVF